MRMVRIFMHVHLLQAISVAVLMTTLACAAVPARAQSQAVAIDSSYIARFQLADSYFRAGKFESAIPLLEDLYAQSPETRAFYDRLKEAYENLKRYDDAIAVAVAVPAALHAVINDAVRAEGRHLDDVPVIGALKTGRDQGKISGALVIAGPVPP